MYVCLCRGVTDEHIREAVGAGAATLQDLGESLGVATRCGRCREHACGLLREACGALAPCARATLETASA